jgi:hypothetical protein
MKSFYWLCLLIFPLTFFLNGCSVLVGQVKPVDEKASEEAIINKVPDLASIDPDWKKIVLAATFSTSEDTPDAAWQSQKTAAVISINSACSQLNDERSSVAYVTTSLLSQWRHLKIIHQADTKLSGYPALETTAEGYYLNRTRKFQTVAVKTTTCVYDLIYLSPVNSFDQELSAFQKFRDNLVLK